MVHVDPEIIRARIGYAADPAIEMLLNKDLLARIKVSQLEGGIRLLEMQLETARMTLDALRKQYEIK